MDVLMVSPATPGQIVAGKALAGLFYIGVTLAVALILFAPLIVHWELALASFLAASLVSVALGLLVGSWASTRQQLQLAVFIGAQPLLLPVFLIIMTDIFPDWLVSAMSWIPTVSTATLFRAACIESPALADVAQPLAVSTVSIVLLLALVVAAVRRQDR